MIISTAEREELKVALDQELGSIPSLTVKLANNCAPISVSERRRGRTTTAKNEGVTLSLLADPNGVLLWEDAFIRPRRGPGLRRGRPGEFLAGDPVAELVVPPLAPNQVAQVLVKADKMLTPNQGLFEWKNGAMHPAPEIRNLKKGTKILLIVHGTFSESEAIFRQWTDPANAEAIKFLAKAGEIYNYILAFNHPTVAVSPTLNALDLARLTVGSGADIDVIAHSRGGLVVRWWLEAFDRPVGKRRAVLVGSPLGGTSLAAPAEIKKILSWLSNVNRAISKAADSGATLVPWLRVVGVLAQFTGMVTGVAAKTPLVDGGIAMIPGLAAQSRTTTNFEIDRLNGGPAVQPEYFVIRSKYKPNDPGWKFWEYFVDGPKERALFSIFPSDNDTVVDTVEMDRFAAKAKPSGLYEFSTGSVVHHTNYFLQRQTSEQIRGWLQI
jgi:pimeloyl-ACP methyl ester carboxylesterase